MIGPAFAVLLADAQGGDEHAFGVLYRDLQPSVLRYLRVLAPRLPRIWPRRPGCGWCGSWIAFVVPSRRFGPGCS
jgi:hypothetical protein